MMKYRMRRARRGKCMRVERSEKPLCVLHYSRAMERIWRRQWQSQLAFVIAHSGSEGNGSEEDGRKGTWRPVTKLC